MDPDELAARRIADRGRAALVQRLRVVFAQTAARGPQAGEIDPQRLEQLVQAAADRADGASWRRALAEVAVDELGISLGEAVEHPAVRRAQAMLGVPAYAPDTPEPAPDTPEPAPDTPEPAPDTPEPAPDTPEPAPDTPEPAPDTPEPAPDTPEPAPDTPEPAPDTPEPAPDTPEPAPDTPEPKPDTPEPEPDTAAPAPRPASAIRVAAVHLGGIETVREGDRQIELRFSDAGLDVIGTRDGESIGRLTWTEIADVQFPRHRRSIRRRHPSGAELIVRTDRGEARFELPDLDPEQARKHLAPVLARARGVRFA